MLTPIKLKRMLLGLKPQEIAKQLNCSLSFYYKIESGKRYPTLITAYKLAKILNSSIDELFGTQLQKEMETRSVSNA